MCWNILGLGQRDVSIQGVKNVLDPSMEVKKTFFQDRLGLRGKKYERKRFEK